MSQAQVLDKPCTEISPSLGQVICIHPHADKASHVYYFDALVSHKDHLERRQVLVVSPSDSLAAVNRAVWAELGDRWFCVQFRVRRKNNATR
jgi:hypothetical protein